MAAVDERRKRRKELVNYYGLSSIQQENMPSLDIDSKHFNQDMYIQKIVKEKNLKQLLEEESILVSEVQRLDSDCQTLVYDHYDKFISATDIVRQMKEGSSEMSAQVSQLQEIMTKITQSSQSITEDLQVRRDSLSHYLSIHSTLKKLQFLFQLPQKIDECIKEKKFLEGVRSYTETSEVLQRYQHLPSFSAIYFDCQSALKKLNAALKEELAMKQGSARHLTLCVDLLLQLGEPAEALCDDFLQQARRTLEEDLRYLTSIAVQATPPPSESSPELSEESPKIYQDVLQFIDICHDTFIANLWLVISSYKEMFLRSETLVTSESVALLKLCSFVCDLIEEYVNVVNMRVASEENYSQDYYVLTTALDKFHRRLHAITQLLPNSDFSDKSMDLILKAGQSRCSHSLQWLKDNFVSNLADVRQALASPKQVTQDSSESTQLNELLTRLVASTAANIKDRVTALQCFNQPKHTFSMRPEFRDHFCRHLVREGVIVAFFKHITKSLCQFCHKGKSPSLLLLLSRMCLDLHTSTIHYLLSYCDEQLQLEDKCELTPLQVLTSAMKETGQNLLNNYVTAQGSTVSQMLRRSVELKDWLGCSEPRSVRRVMRTVRDEIASMDIQVGALYEEGARKDRSSDSSRRTFHSLNTSRFGGGGAARSSGWSGYAPNLDNSLVANLNKLWSERIEIFAPVEFTRVSILTGVIKISLKTLLESVRLRSFSRFGFQQVQVDTHYLRTYLWSYVADENILNALLDEVLTSASLRSTDPELMELKVVEFICEQN